MQTMQAVKRMMAMFQKIKKGQSGAHRREKLALVPDLTKAESATFFMKAGSR